MKSVKIYLKYGIRSIVYSNPAFFKSSISIWYFVKKEIILAELSISKKNQSLFHNRVLYNHHLYF